MVHITRKKDQVTQYTSNKNTVLIMAIPLALCASYSGNTYQIA